MAVRLDPKIKLGDPGEMAAGAWLSIPMLFVISFCAAGAEPAKPACNAQTRGNLWPENTTHGSEVPVEICSKAHWKYRWEQLTVDVSRLKGAVARKPIVAGLDIVAHVPGQAKTETVATQTE